MWKVTLISLLVAAPLSAQAAADPVDNYASTQIAKGDYATAEAMLTAHLSRRPGDSPALINLAYIYKRTGRTQEANALYRRVLQHLDTMVAPIGSDEQILSSREIALQALSQRTKPAAVAAR